MPTRLSKEVLNAAIEGFIEQKKRIDAQIADIRQIMSGGSANGAAPAKRTRGVSAATRARISAAQRKRWAQAQQAARSQTAHVAAPTPVRKKRRLSAAGRLAIIAATRRRWAAIRKAQAQK